jgi:predicted transcriptional regulator
MADAALVAQSLVAKIVSGYVKKNRIAPADVSALIDTVHQSLLGLTKPVEPEPKRTPAVSIRRSVTPNYVVCLDCGRRAKMLRGHLQSSHGLTPNEYRARWGLPRAHPLTAPAYSERRSALAKKIGLGQKQIGRRRQQAPQQPA